MCLSIRLESGLIVFGCLIILAFSDPQGPKPNEYQKCVLYHSNVNNVMKGIKEVLDLHITQGDGFDKVMKGIQVVLDHHIAKDDETEAELRQLVNSLTTYNQILTSINTSTADIPNLRSIIENIDQQCNNSIIRENIPTDCLDIRNNGHLNSGIYNITPPGQSHVNVYCDQETVGGGWTVFLQRQKKWPRVYFNKTFEDYAQGFGESEGEYWLGNRNLHALTGGHPHVLWVEATNLKGEKKHGTWGTFEVGSETTQFKITVTDYDSFGSSLGDGLSGDGNTTYKSNQMKFSTFESDHNNCSKERGNGGWWYDHCYGANPTAPMADEPLNAVLNWFFWDKDGYLAYTRLSWLQFKMRRQ